MLYFSHCDPAGIAINSQNGNKNKEPSPHRGNFRAFDCVGGFVMIPAPWGMADGE